MTDRETAIRMAQDAGFCHDVNHGIYLCAPMHIERLAALFAAAEREAIAEHVDVIAEDHEERGDITKATVADQIAAAIRAQGKQK